MVKQLSSDRVQVDTLEAAIELYFERGWTDDPPLVPPTENAAHQRQFSRL